MRKSYSRNEIKVDVTFDLHDELKGIAKELPEDGEWKSKIERLIQDTLEDEHRRLGYEVS